MNHHSCLHIPARLGGVALLTSLAAWSVAAQNAASTNAPTVMEKTVVEGLPLDETVLPTARPLSSVLGDDRSIIDTPRSVSLITKAQMEARGISQMTDIGQLAPGAYTPERYGLPGVPVIRGDLAEIYQNGQRMLYSRDSILPSFNQVEALDVVKGPGSAIYGPQGQGPGGYVNFVTKQPYFDQFHADVTTKWGTYVPGGQSFFSPEWNLDLGGPINKELAYRVSYLGREADSYYQNVKNDTQDIFTALTWRPNEKLELDWTAQYINSRFNEITGINRVTQELIDREIYNAGPVLPNNAFGGPVYPDGGFAILDPAQAHKVKIYGYEALTSPGDIALGQKFNSQLITTYYLSDSAKIVNLSYGEFMETQKFEQYGYSEFVPVDWMINNRTELHFDFDVKAGSHDFAIKTISGVDFRYQKLLSYQDFTDEPFFIYDLSNPASSLTFPTATGTVGGGLPIIGHPKYGITTFYDFSKNPPVPVATPNGSQDSELTQVGLFTQWEAQIFEKFSIVTGGRLDILDANAASPEIVGYSKGYFYQAEADVLDPSVFVSGIYKWTPTVSSYVTYDLTEAVTGSPNFGGVDGTGGNSGLRRSLQAESQLIEVGTKASLFHNQVYVGVAAFDQSRLRPNLTGPASLIDTRGIELEAVYQPNRNFNLNANLTLQDSYNEYPPGASGYEQTANYLDGYPVGFPADSAAPGGGAGLGNGSPNYAGNNVGRLPLAAAPKLLFNAYATYMFESGFGFSVGPQVQSSQRANQEGTLIIPAQYVFNASFFYKRPKWEVQINFFNFTDQRNWTSIDPDFAGNDVIFPELPFHISGLVKYKF